MKIYEKRKMQVVASGNPIEFQDGFNEAMDALAEYEPQYEIREVGGGLWAIITWTVTERIPDSVRDEYHMAGVRYVCDQCPLHEVVKDKRVKIVKCEHTETGSTNRGHECCEHFYTLLKEGKIDAPERTVKEPVWRKI